MVAKQIPAEELPDFVSSLVRELMKPHEKRFVERVKAVTKSAMDFEQSAVRFGAGIKNAWGSLDKNTADYGLRLSQIIRERSVEVSNRKSDSSFQNVEEFHKNSVHALNEVITAIRRYMPKLHRAPRPEATALNSSLLKLENEIKALGRLLDASPGAKLESLRQEAELLVARQTELDKLRVEDNQELNALNEASQREEEVDSQREALTSAHEFQELKHFEDLLSSKEAEIKQFVQPLMKPLIKLERAASAKKDSTVDTFTLQKLVHAPIDTLLTGQSFAFMGLLERLDQAIKDNELDLEERKSRRAQEVVRMAKEGMLDKVREDYLTLRANLQETMRQLKAKGYLEKKNQIDALTSQVRAEKEAATARREEVKRKIAHLDKELLKQKASIESRIESLAKVSVSILAGE